MSLYPHVLYVLRCACRRMSCPAELRRQCACDTGMIQGTLPLMMLVYGEIFEVQPKYAAPGSAWVCHSVEGTCMGRYCMARLFPRVAGRVHGCGSQGYR